MCSHGERAGRPLLQTLRRHTGGRKVHDPMVRDLVEDPAECPKNSISRSLGSDIGAEL